MALLLVLVLVQQPVAGVEPLADMLVAGALTAVAADQQSVRSARPLAAVALPICWPYDGPLHRQHRPPRRFVLLSGL